MHSVRRYLPKPIPEDMPDALSARIAVANGEWAE